MSLETCRTRSRDARVLTNVVICQRHWALLPREFRFEFRRMFTPLRRPSATDFLNAVQCGMEAVWQRKRGPELL